ncbi:MAG TPA: hypothetical protein DDX51_01750 [Clostridiales bacterium]|nr:hypothetical protein [Clostridiales bacterium]
MLCLKTARIFRKVLRMHHLFLCFRHPIITQFSGFVDKAAVLCCLCFLYFILHAVLPENRTGQRIEKHRRMVLISFSEKCPGEFFRAGFLYNCALLP